MNTNIYLKPKIFKYSNIQIFMLIPGSRKVSNIRYYSLLIWSSEVHNVLVSYCGTKLFSAISYFVSIQCNTIAYSALWNDISYSSQRSTCCESWTWIENEPPPKQPFLTAISKITWMTNKKKTRDLASKYNVPLGG